MEGHREHFWHGEGRPFFDVVHPVVPLWATASPTLQVATFPTAERGPLHKSPHSLPQNEAHSTSRHIPYRGTRPTPQVATFPTVERGPLHKSPHSLPQNEAHSTSRHIPYRGTRPSFFAVVLLPPAEGGRRSANSAFVVLENTAKLKSVSKQTSF